MGFRNIQEKLEKKYHNVFNSFLFLGPIKTNAINRINAKFQQLKQICSEIQKQCFDFLNHATRRRNKNIINQNYQVKYSKLIKVTITVNSYTVPFLA